MNGVKAMLLLSVTRHNFAIIAKVLQCSPNMLLNTKTKKRANDLLNKVGLLSLLNASCVFIFVVS